LKVTAQNGCADSITQTVTVAAYPIAAVTANAPLTFCKDDSVTLSVPYNEDFVYSWKPEGTNISVSDSSNFAAKFTGTYIAEVTNSKANCSTSSTPVVITVRNAPLSPTIQYTGPKTFCQGDSTVMSVSNTSGYSYQWKLNGGAVGANSNQYIARSSGNYSLVVSNSDGCSVSSINDIDVTVKPLPVSSSVSLIGDKRFCSGKSINLSVPDNSDYSYTWKNGITELDIKTNNIDINKSGDYMVEISLAGCKITTETVTIEVVENPGKPDIDAGSYRDSICLGENPLKLSVANVVSGYSYQWYKNETPVSTEPAIEITEAGNYYLEAVIDICRSERSTLPVTFAPAPPKPEIIARGPTVWFLTTTSKAANYKWFLNSIKIPDASGSSYVAGQKYGIYRLAVSDDGECFSFSDTLRVPTGAVGIEDTDPFEDVKIYPNPTTGTFTIEMNNNVFGELVIDIITQNGSKILNIKFEKATEHFISEIDLSGQSKGMYLINLSIDKFKAVRKVVVE
jgi:hypothetical protein